MKAIINKKVFKTMFFLPVFCLGIFLFGSNAGAALTMTPDGGALAGGITGVAYSELARGNNCSDYVWALTSGSLPDGLTYGNSQTSGNWSGNPVVISGNPTKVGTFSFNLKLSANCGGGMFGGSQSITRSFSITVIAGIDPIITTLTLPDGLINATYSQNIDGAYGVEPYTWAITSGTLPTGLSMASTSPSATISGTPTVLGVYTFTVELTDASLKVDSKEYTINISNILITTSSPLPNGMEGDVYNSAGPGITFTGIGGASASYVWSVPDGADLPPGLSLTSGGLLSGVPTATGSYYFLVELTDGTDFTSKWFDIYIEQNDLSILTVSPLPDGVACASYSENIVGEGVDTPYGWSVVAGSLPPGLTLTSYGTPSSTISGIPIEVGIFSFTVSISDVNSVTRQKVFEITITGSASDCLANLDDNTAYPAFVLEQESVQPNILLIYDNSGSMYEFAYKDAGKSQSRPNQDISYNSGTTYYGYFECNANIIPRIMYSYDSTNQYFYKSLGGTWDGCFLNWLTMRRVDVARKVLVGGKVIPRDTSATNLLIAAEGPNRNFWKAAAGQTYRVYSLGGYEVIRVCTDPGQGNCGSGDGTIYRVVINVGNTVPEGVIQETYNDVRWGLMFFNYQGRKFENNGASQKDGGYIKTELGGPLNDLVTNIQNEDPNTWTPLAETFYEAIRYFQRTNSAYNSGVDYSTLPDPIQYWCQDNFVIVLTDGESTKDRNIPGGYWNGYVSKVTDSNCDIQTQMSDIATEELKYSSVNLAGLPWANEYDTSPNAQNSYRGTYYLEGVAYYARRTDLRSDLEGVQDVSTYTIYAFDESSAGRTILSTTAKYGGFVESPDTANNIPDNENEWNQDGDLRKIPDAFFEAGEGSVLYDRLLETIRKIKESTSSGTSAAVLSTSGDGEGAVYQAYFNPSQQNVSWIGNTNGLFLDKYGNIREDSRGDAQLCYGADDPAGCPGPNTIISMYFDVTTKQTKVKRYPGEVEVDEYGKPTGVPVGPSVTVNLRDIDTIWDAGERLWLKDANLRKVFTTLNGYDSTGLGVDPDKGSFYDGNASALQSKLGVASSTDAANIINYIRGVEIAGQRSRIMGVDLNGDGVFSDPGEKGVWKLGDIVYSTPLVVPQPKENYDLLYNDLSYYYFKLNYYNRRNVVYAGANDGMLHAFNAGFYDMDSLKYCKGGDANSDWTISGSECAGSGGEPELGDELWGFVPRGVLPNLGLLMRPDYTHVYYVDLQPKVSDVKLFSCDATHIGDTSDSVCWGTILIGGLRYGAKESLSTGPEYFALDITDPVNPRILWTFSDPGMGLSMSYPVIARTCDASGTSCKQFAVFGSGPTNYDANSNLTAFQSGTIYVLDISSGINGVIPAWTENTNFWKFYTGNTEAFLSSPITVDVDLDYDVDVIYIAENYKAGGYVCSNDLVTTCAGESDTVTCTFPATCVSTWNTKMLRLTTDKGRQNNPANWMLSTLANINNIDTSGYDKARRVMSFPAAVMDDFSNLWVFFGTGQFLGTLDKSQPANGAFYGIRDQCWDGLCASEYTNLNDVSNVIICPDGASTCTGTDDFATLETEIEETYDGWVIYHNAASLVEVTDFAGKTIKHNGERVINSPAIIGGLVVWPTFVPSGDVCGLGGESNMYAVYYKTGSAYSKYVFGSQKSKVESSGTDEAISRVVRVGEGMPSDVSVQVDRRSGSSGGTARGFMPSSNGTLQSVSFDLPSAPKSKEKAWRDEEIK